jgi:hypothetical protein
MMLPLPLAAYFGASEAARKYRARRGRPVAVRCNLRANQPLVAADHCHFMPGSPGRFGAALLLG